MPRIKKDRVPFSIETALVFQPEITKFANRKRGIFLGRDEYKTMAEFACHPLHRKGLSVRTGLLDHFGRLYSTRPDDVIEFLQLARRILNKWETTQAGKIIRFLCKHTLSPIDDRNIIYDATGNPIEVEIINKINRKRRRISFKNKTEQEIDKLQFPQLVTVNSLSDKELSVILDVKPDSVKKARQEMAKISHEVKYWNNQVVSEYMRTGIKSPELAAITDEYLKGKK